MNLLNVVNNLATKKPEPFVAPIPFARTVSVTTMQHGAPWKFNVPNPRPGWWVLTPHNRVATIDKDAQPTEYLDYLNVLPRFYVIALFPTSATTWLVTPYSIADANQRGWKDGQPREVHLVRGMVEPFDVLVTRAMAGVLLFDDIDTRLGTHTIVGMMREMLSGNEGTPFSHDVNWLNAYRTVYAQAQALLIEQKKAEAARQLQEAQSSVENQIKWQLEFMGATLRDIHRNRKSYRVTWVSPDGREYSMRVGDNLHIESAGLCLAGSDRLHNLSSIVNVMTEAVLLRRPDLPGAQRDNDDSEDDWDD